MKKTLLALTITTSTLMAVSVAQADNFYMGASAGYNYLDTSRNYADYSESYGNLNLGIDFGYRLSQIGVDIGLHIIPPQKPESITVKRGDTQYTIDASDHKIKEGQYILKATYAFLGTEEDYIIKPYAGITLGGYSLSGKTLVSDTDKTELDFGFGALIGAERAINDRFVAFVEASYARIERTRSKSNNFKGIVGLKFLF